MYNIHTLEKHAKRRQSKPQISFFSSNIAIAISSFLKAIEMFMEFLW